MTQTMTVKPITGKHLDKDGKAVLIEQDRNFDGKPDFTQKP